MMASVNGTWQAACGRPVLSSLFLCLAFLATAAPLPLSADQAAHDWLNRMNRALRELDYQGRFVYQTQQNLEAMLLVHSVQDESEHERLLSLNGDAREVIRDNDLVVCRIQGQDGHVKESKRPTGRSFSPLQAIRPEQLEKYYAFELADQTRVAGREAQQVMIHPRDELRYGYQLSLDREHALPLRSLTLDSEGEVVSQILFTDMQVGAAAISSEQRRHVPGLHPESGSGQRQLARPKPTRWRFASLPAGFELTLHRMKQGSNSAMVEHFVFTDGLATVSVYAEALGGTPFKGWSRMGAVRALGRNIGDYQVTAVGEVPKKTLAMLLDAMQLREP